MCAQDSRAIVWLLTVVFETDAVGIMVREQCPARFPLARSLVSIMTLLLLISCAGLSTEKLGGPQAGLHRRRISTSLGRQRSLGEFPPHFLKPIPARDPFAPPARSQTDDPAARSTLVP